MTTDWEAISPKGKSGGDWLYYLLAAMSGALAGWLDIKVGDLLLTAMVVLSANMLLGFLSPRRPWRWVVIVWSVRSGRGMAGLLVSYAEAGARTDLRIFPRIPAGDCRCLRRIDRTRRGG